MTQDQEQAPRQEIEGLTMMLFQRFGDRLAPEEIYRRASQFAGYRRGFGERAAEEVAAQEKAAEEETEAHAIRLAAEEKAGIDAARIEAIRRRLRPVLSMPDPLEMIGASLARDARFCGRDRLRVHDRGRFVDVVEMRFGISHRQASELVRRFGYTNDGAKMTPRERGERHLEMLEEDGPTSGWPPIDRSRIPPTPE